MRDHHLSTAGRNPLPIDIESGKCKTNTLMIEDKIRRIDGTYIVHSAEKDCTVLKTGAGSLAVESRCHSVIMGEIADGTSIRIQSGYTRFPGNPDAAVIIIYSRMHYIAGETIIGTIDIKTRNIILKIQSVESAPESAQPGIVFPVSEHIYHIVVAQRTDIPRYLLHKMKTCKFRSIRRFEPD